MRHIQKIRIQMFMFQSIYGLVADFYGIKENLAIWLMHTLRFQVDISVRRWYRLREFRRGAKTEEEIIYSYEDVRMEGENG